MENKELLIQYDQEVNRLRSIINHTRSHLEYLILVHLEQGKEINIIDLKHLEDILKNIDKED